MLIDVYRGRISGVKGFIPFANHIVMFPKLLSGPIAYPLSLQKQEHAWKGSWALFGEGIQNLFLGLGMKVVLAGRMGGIWAQANLTGFADISTAYAWIALVSWALELYLDFYGYSLMAIGLGQMLGYQLPENFLIPYASRSVSEFWRRWHVTLGAWFKSYLYIPLGGSRKGTLRTLLNLAVVWLFTGLWHGVGGNYLLWALFLYFLIVNERLWLGKVLDKIGFLRHGYVVFAILLSWVPFAVGDFGQMMTLLSKLFGGGEAINPLDYRELVEYIPMLLSGILLATPVPKMLWNKIRNGPLGFCILLVIFWAVVFYISTAAQDPFMYFQY
jgi:alginate O-acetyltransferase complex protein AlgI